MTRRLTVFLLALCLLTLAFVACGTTRGAPATAILRLAHSTGTFTTMTGWEVTLDEAFLVLGGAYVYAPDGDPTASAAPWLERGLGLGPSRALAHGGHDPFGSRRVRTEWLGPARLDLLAPAAVDVGPMDGSVGPTTDVTLSFEPLSGEDADPSAPNHGHHAWIAGTATRTVMGSTETIAFEGGLDFDAGGTENLIETVDGVAMVAARGSWELRAELPRWLDQAHFERLPDAPTRLVTATSQPGIAWDLGLRDPAAYTLVYAPALED